MKRTDVLRGQMLTSTEFCFRALAAHPYRECVYTLSAGPYCTCDIELTPVPKTKKRSRVNLPVPGPGIEKFVGNPTNMVEAPATRGLNKFQRVLLLTSESAYQAAKHISFFDKALGINALQSAALVEFNLGIRESKSPIHAQANYIADCRVVRG